MSEMYDVTIMDILGVAITAAVQASSEPLLPVKHIGRTSPPNNDGRYLEAVLITTNRNGDFWGSEKNYQGTLRLILHWPADETGAIPPSAVLASICSYFNKDEPLQNLRIRDNPDFGGVLEEGAANLYPASIRYQCFRP
jgi:hypothetical protein